MYTTDWNPDLPPQPAGKPTGSLKIISEKEVTVEDVVKIGDEAWAMCKKLMKRYKSEYADVARMEAKTRAEQDAKLEAKLQIDEKILSEVRKKFPEFSMSYAIVLRHNLSLQRYSSVALRNYVKHIAKHPWTTEDEYLRAQAHYAVCLYKATVHPWNETMATYTFNTVYNTLKNEHEKFKSSAEECSKRVDEFEANVRKKREEALMAWLKKNHGVKPSAPNPIIDGIRAMATQKLTGTI